MVQKSLKKFGILLLVLWLCQSYLKQRIILSSVNGYLDDVIRPLNLILRKISGYVKTFKDKNGDKDNNKNNKLMSYCIDNDKLSRHIKHLD